ncbi:hypothetical protein OAJ09_00350 [Candidatus Pelagibacter sp.]|nr:hypothetical protein [Candidatus Pelagibacter sp.]
MNIFKKKLLFFITTIFLLFSIITIIFISKFKDIVYLNNPITEYEIKNIGKIDNYGRYWKFYLLKNNYKNQNFIFGSSSIKYMNPVSINKGEKYLALNMTMPGFTIDELEKYINWIVLNKQNTQDIIIFLKSFSFDKDKNYKIYLPYELEISNYGKIQNLYNKINFSRIVKLILKSKISNKENKQKNEQLTNDDLNSFNYGHQINNNFQKFKSTKKFKLNYTNEIDIEYDEYVNKLFRINQLLIDKNINVKYVFDPVYYEKLLLDNKIYHIFELELIEKLLKKINKIYYYNNFNKYNFSTDFTDFDHYSADLANKILSEIVFPDIKKNYIVLDKHNFINFKKQINEKQ